MGIYGILASRDLLNMRLLSRDIKKEVDEHMSFHLKFDQSNSATRLKRLLLLRIRSCHMVHFASRRLFHRCTKLFSYPNRLKKLTFDGVVSSSNLLKVLNQCCRVKHLVFTHQTLGIEGLIQSVKFDPCIQKLNAVTHLDLQLLRYPQGDPFEAEENIEAFLRATFPNLQSFRLYFSLWGNFSSLLKFLDRHRQTLKELELQVGDRGDSLNTESYLKANPMKIMDHERKNLATLNLTQFRFRDDVLNLNQPAKELIVNILLAQKQLQVFQFYSPGELSWSMLRSVILSNESSLTEIVVYNVQTTVPEEGGPRRQQIPENQANQVPELYMDMSIFSKCSQLKTLALSCASSNGNDPNVVGTVMAKMTNLHCISCSVERLHLTGFTLDGQELVSLTQTGENKLKEVLIADAGAMRYSDVLNSFLKNCINLSYLNVRPVVLQAANEQLWWKEVHKLSQLYERFMGISYDPIDDLEGFEANISDSDKEWLESYVPTFSTYSTTNLPLPSCVVQINHES